jgi:hypothetical protein
MKKSILASIFAGTLAFSSFASDEHHIMKIELKKETGSPTVLNINNDGDTQVFEFTEEELNDEYLLETRLADLDDETKTAVMNALKGIHLSDGKMMWVDNSSDSDDDKKIVVVKSFGTIDGAVEHDVLIDMQGSTGHQMLHKVVENKDGKHFAFKFGNGNNIKLHHDSANPAKVIEQLLKHSKLTPEQIDQIQQSLDAKRD